MKDNSRASEKPDTWYYWLDTSHSPALNMAIDETLLGYAAHAGRCIVRFYQWDRPSISIGYLQDFKAGYREGFAVVRRPTGGGVVFHDHDFTYTAVIPAGHWITELDREASYKQINCPVMAGLQKCRLAPSLSDAAIPQSVSRRTMVCFKNPTRYDIVLGDRKVAGSAQRRVREGILHQGSIHFGEPLPVPRNILAKEIIAGFQLELGVEMAAWQPDSAIMKTARDLAAGKYALDAWNRKR